MRVFQNGMLWRIFGRKGEEIVRKWRNLLNEEFHFLQMRKMGWTVCVASTGRYGYILIRKTEGNRPLGRPRYKL
jgi:hypothetical protein